MKGVGVGRGGNPILPSHWIVGSAVIVTGSEPPKLCKLCIINVWNHKDFQFAAQIISWQ